MKITKKPLDTVRILPIIVNDGGGYCSADKQTVVGIGMRWVQILPIRRSGGCAFENQLLVRCLGNKKLCAVPILTGSFAGPLSPGGPGIVIPQRLLAGKWSVYL